MAEPLVLYHGTTSKARHAIRRRGLRKFTWASTSRKDAETFAKVKADMEGGKPEVWSLVPEVSIEKIAWPLGEKTGKFFKFFRKPNGKLVYEGPV